MKTLLVLRHAHAEASAASGGDHARALTDSGQQTARRVGRFLASAQALPHHALTSSATRARQTLDAVAEAAGEAWRASAEVTDALYDTSPDGVLAQVHRAPAEADVLLLVGHQPTWGALVGRLIGLAQVRLPTAAVACLDLGARRWEEADFGRGTLRWLVPPEVLPPAGPAER